LSPLVYQFTKAQSQRTDLTDGVVFAPRVAARKLVEGMPPWSMDWSRMLGMHSVMLASDSDPDGEEAGLTPLSA
jgi:hypothetical protein